MTDIRPLSEIALEIEKSWPDPPGNVPAHIGALKQVRRITDHYKDTPVAAIVRRPLDAADTWQGQDAEFIKAELEAML